MIEQGQHWAVDYALRRSGIELPVPVQPRVYRLDRVWLRSDRYISDRCMRPLSIPRLEQLRSGQTLPNHWHPSDHLPLGIRLVKASG